jgi:hypothetical protein
LDQGSNVIDFNDSIKQLLNEYKLREEEMEQDLKNFHKFNKVDYLDLKAIQSKCNILARNRVSDKMNRRDI